MDEATRIINTATNEELVKMHFEELTKIRKLRLVIKELKQIDCSKLMLPDKKQVEKSIALIKIGEYFFLNGKKDHVLGRYIEAFPDFVIIFSFLYVYQICAK